MPPPDALRHLLLCDDDLPFRAALGAAFTRRLQQDRASFGEAVRRTGAKVE